MKIELDVHTHTLASGHAYSTIREMAKAASEKGLKLLGITEHAQGIPGTCTDIYFVNLKVVPREMYGVELMLGSEINILDYNGRLSMEDSLMDRLDVRIAGLHDLCYTSGSIEQNTNAVVEAIKNPRIDIISHPDNGFFPLDYEAVVQAAKKYNTLLELNNNSLHPRNKRIDARENSIHMLELCREYRAPIIISSDAHVDMEVGQMDFALELINQIGFPEELIINRNVTEFKNIIKLSRL